MCSQRPLFALVLINNFVNDLDKGIKYTFSEFADDSKSGRSAEVRKALQRVMDRLDFKNT